MILVSITYYRNIWDSSCKTSLKVATYLCIAFLLSLAV